MNTITKGERRNRRKNPLERIDDFLSRDDGSFHAERIQMLRRIMFGDLPEELESTPHPVPLPVRGGEGNGKRFIRE